MKTETPYVETEALLAMMRGDRDEALRLVDEMLPNERASLSAAACALATFADSRNRCPGCDRFVPLTEAITVGLLGPRELWHRSCRDESMQES